MLKHLIVKFFTRSLPLSLKQSRIFRCLTGEHKEKSTFSAVYKEDMRRVKDLAR